MSKQIPGTPPWQPPIPGPQTAPPAEGDLWQIGSHYKESFPPVILTHSQYWKRIYFHDIECGQQHSQTIATEVGAEQQAIAEFSSELGVKVPGLSAKLGSKLGTSVTISVKHSSSFTVTTATGPCEGASIAVWQLVDQFTLEIFYPFFTSKFVLTVPQDVYDQDVLKYPKPECCPETPRKKPKKKRKKPGKKKKTKSSAKKARIRKRG